MEEPDRYGGDVMTDNLTTRAKAALEDNISKAITAKRWQRNYPPYSDNFGDWSPLCQSEIICAIMDWAAPELIAALEAAEKEHRNLAAWQCLFIDGKTGLVNDESGYQYCQMRRRAEAAEASAVEATNEANACGAERAVWKERAVEAEAEVEALRAALAFYGTKSNWESDLLPDDYPDDMSDDDLASLVEDCISKVEADGGAVARAALAQIGESHD